MLCLIFKYCIAGYHVVWFLAGEPRDPPAQEALPTPLPGMQAYKGTGSGIFFNGYSLHLSVVLEWYILYLTSLLFRNGTGKTKVCCPMIQLNPTCFRMVQLTPTSV